MSTNILGSANFGDIALGNGSSLTGVSASFPLSDFRKPLWVSDFNIEPPRVKMDPLAVEIVERTSKKLKDKPLKYKSRQRKDWMLKHIMNEDDKKGTDARSKLVREGHSATISEVSSTINRSNADHTVRFLLSNEPLYVFALSFVIFYEKVKDAEGINDRVIAVTETEIRPFFNKLLAREVIRRRHLELSKDQKEAIFGEVGKIAISYLRGAPMGTISKVISKYVDQGSLHRLVDKFFESGEIDPAKGTPQIRQLMVNYLKQIGLVVKEKEAVGELEEEIDYAEMEGMEEEAYDHAGEDEDNPGDYNQMSR